MLKRHGLALCIFLVLSLAGTSDAAAQYNPFEPNSWDLIMGCANTYTSGLADCNAAASACWIAVAQGTATGKYCQNQYGICRHGNAGSWSTCMGNVPIADPWNNVCEEARARRNACYQYMDYCSSLVLNPDDQLICDEGAYYCTVTSGVSQCE